MCGFCGGNLTAKGNFYGKNIKISKCANETSLTDCQIAKSIGDEKYGVVIFSYGYAMGYFDIDYCPMCGRDLRGKSEND